MLALAGGQIYDNAMAFTSFELLDGNNLQKPSQSELNLTNTINAFLEKRNVSRRRWRGLQMGKLQPGVTDRAIRLWFYSGNPFFATIDDHYNPLVTGPIIARTALRWGVSGSIYSPIEDVTNRQISLEDEAYQRADLENVEELEDYLLWGGTFGFHSCPARRLTTEFDIVWSARERVGVWARDKMSVAQI